MVSKGKSEAQKQTWTKLTNEEVMLNNVWESITNPPVIKDELVAVLFVAEVL